jgi:hypothetical protein
MLSSPCYNTTAPSVLQCSNKVGFPLHDFMRCSSFYRVLLICEMHDLVQIMLQIFNMVL